MSGDLQLELPDAAATEALGCWLGQTLPAGSNLLLVGELGAGKTALVRGLGLGLGIAEPVVSPTFALLNEYLDGRLPLYHFDLYRLERSSEVDALAPDTYWGGPDCEVDPGIVAIEWAQRLPFAPECYLEIRLRAAHGCRIAELRNARGVPPEIWQALRERFRAGAP